MGSLIGDWPSFDPRNFSQLRPSDPSASTEEWEAIWLMLNSLTDWPSENYQQFLRHKLAPATYHSTHNRALPPPNQVITTESRNILLRQIYQKAEDKLRPKRAATDHLAPEHGCKQPRGNFADDSNQHM